MTEAAARQMILESYSREELEGLIRKFSESADRARALGCLNVAAGDLVRAHEFRAELDRRAA